MKTLVKALQGTTTAVERRIRIMPVLNRILVPTDFSKPSLAAVEAALTLLQGSEDPLLVLVHVLQLQPALGVVDGGVTPDLQIDCLLESAQMQMARLRKQYGPRITLECQVLIGSPVQQINEMLSHGKFDLVAMSSHGRSGFGRLLMGSVAEGLVHHAPCSVLVLKAPVDADGQHDWSLPPAAGFKKLLVGYDHRPGASAALDAAEEISSRTGASITLVHAIPETEPATPLDVLRGVEIASRESIEAHERLHRLVEGLHLPAIPAVFAATGKPWEVIAKAATDLDADLVIVGPHEHFHRAFDFIGSTAQRLVRLAPCSVLALK